MSRARSISWTTAEDHVNDEDVVVDKEDHGDNKDLVGDEDLVDGESTRRTGLGRQVFLLYRWAGAEGRRLA